MQLHPEPHRRYFNLNPENLSAYKPDQYQPSEEYFKLGFKEKISRSFKDLFKSDKCLTLRLSIATQLSINLLFA